MPTLNRQTTTLIGLSCVMWVACSEAQKPAQPLPTPPQKGWQAAALEVVDAERLKRSVGASREVLVVALWAHWCDPCIAEMPELTALSLARPDWGVWSLSTDDLSSPHMGSRVQAVFDKVAPRHAQGRIEPGGEHRLLAALGLEWDGMLPKTFLVRPGDAIELEGRTRDELMAEIERIRQGRSADPARGPPQ